MKVYIFIDAGSHPADHPKILNVFLNEKDAKDMLNSMKHPRFESQEHEVIE